MFKELLTLIIAPIIVGTVNQMIAEWLHGKHSDKNGQPHKKVIPTGIGMAFMFVRKELLTSRKISVT